MKKTAKQLFVAAPILIAIAIIFNSFKPAERNPSANGAGIADGIYFSFNVVKQKNGTVVGSIQYYNEAYAVVNAEWFGNTVIMYTDGGTAFLATDNGGPRSTDWITDPQPGEYSNRFSPSDFYGRHYVTNGNIQVKP